MKMKKNQIFYLLAFITCILGNLSPLYGNTTHTQECEKIKIAAPQEQENSNVYHAAKDIYR